jgi:hypothetical protein
MLWYGFSSTFMAQRIDQQQSSSIVLLRDKDLKEQSMEIIRVIPVISQLFNCKRIKID